MGARIRAREKPLRPAQNNLRTVYSKSTLTNTPNSLPQNIHQRRNINQHRNKHRRINEIIHNEKLHHEIKHQEQIKAQHQSQDLFAPLTHPFYKAKITKPHI